MNSIRKNITLPEQAYITINNYAKQCGLSFSEFLRKTALNAIEKENEMSLLEYLNTHCDFVDEQEQKEFESLNIDFKNFQSEKDF